MSHVVYSLKVKADEHALFDDIRAMIPKRLSFFVDVWVGTRSCRARGYPWAPSEG